MPACLLKQASITPELWWTLGHDNAPQTFRLLTRTAIEFPEDMGGADEPMLVGHVDLDHRPVIGFYSQDFRSQQGDVVKLHNVVSPAIEYLTDSPSLEVGMASLLGEER